MEERKTILVIDDLPTILEQANEVGSERYRVITATSGMEALEIMKTVKPDVILVDIYMPEMDGFECMKEFKADADICDIPVIIMTTDASIVTEAKGFTQGAADFIRKPLTQEILFKRIDMQLQLTEYRQWKRSQRG